MEKHSEIWDLTLNMAIAAYTHKKPDRQVKRMAKRYKLGTSNPGTITSLDLIIKASQPALLVRMVYENHIS